MTFANPMHYGQKLLRQQVNFISDSHLYYRIKITPENTLKVKGLALHHNAILPNFALYIITLSLELRTMYHQPLFPECHSPVRSYSVSNLTFPT